MCIRAELYKLNVYGEWCALRVAFSDLATCFQTRIRSSSHTRIPPEVQTCSGRSWSSTLLYTREGELIFRHGDHERKFHANSLTASQTSPSLAYVAFYSDIEHEVLKVTGGRRVTVTYNLYLVDPTSKVGARVGIPNFKGVSNLQATLQGLLKSPEFLSEGGTLGFGLTHLYPVTSETNLQEMTSYLKGADAHVYQACRELQLQPSLQVIYGDNEGDRETGIMLDRIAQVRIATTKPRATRALWWRNRVVCP